MSASLTRWAFPEETGNSFSRWLRAASRMAGVMLAKVSAFLGAVEVMLLRPVTLNIMGLGIARSRTSNGWFKFDSSSELPGIKQYFKYRAGQSKINHWPVLNRVTPKNLVFWSLFLKKCSVHFRKQDFLGVRDLKKVRNLCCVITEYFTSIVIVREFVRDSFPSQLSTEESEFAQTLSSGFDCNESALVHTYNRNNK